MYRKNNIKRSSIVNNTSVEGFTIEQKIERLINNKETIKDEAPLIYTEKAQGILPAYDIRTDRFEIAIDGMTKIQKSQQARREEKAKMDVIKGGKEDNMNNGVESTQGTGN